MQVMQRILSLLFIPVLTIDSPAASYAAELPKITVSGFYDFQTAHSDQQPKAALDASSFRALKARNDTELHIGIDGISDLGFKYGARIELEADVTRDITGNSDSNADHTWLFFDFPIGRIELGSNIGPTKTLKVDASSLARATGGIDGDWSYFVAAQLDNAYPQIVTPDLRLAHRDWLGFAAEEKSNKITFYTPVIQGFQAGISYIPDSEVSGTTLSFPDDGLSYQDAAQAALQYRYNSPAFSAVMALTGEHGKADDDYSQDLNAWNVGGMLTYRNFSLAGSYGDWGKTDYEAQKTEEVVERQYWTAGLGYSQEQWGVSATYMRSWGGKQIGNVNNRFDLLSFGTDYRLAPGLTTYVEFSVFDLRQHFWKDRLPEAVHGNNHGNVFIVGTLLSF